LSRVRSNCEIVWATPYDTIRYDGEVKNFETYTNGWIGVHYKDGVTVNYPPQAFYYMIVRKEDDNS